MATDAGTFVAETGLPTLASLRTVWGASSTNVFVGGVSELNVFAGATLRLQATNWVKTDDVRTTAIWGSSATDVWASGDRTLRRWNGTQWQSFNHAAGQIVAIHGSGASDVWFVDGSSITRFDGTRIVGAPSIAGGATWKALRVVAPNDVWVGGPSGRLAHFTGGSAWALHDSGFSTTPFQSDVRGLWAAGAADVWAVGGHFTSALNGGEVSHWNGTSWTATAIPAVGALQAVWGSGPNDVWAVGQGVVHYDGATWSRVTVPTLVTLNAVWGSAANDVWAVGGDGVILHFDGTAWSQVAPTVARAAVVAIWAASATELFAVGNDVLRSTGNGVWVKEQSAHLGRLSSVHGTSASDVWAVGTGETTVHRTSAGWSRVAVPTIADAGKEMEAPPSTTCSRSRRTRCGRSGKRAQ